MKYTMMVCAFLTVILMSACAGPQEGSDSRAYRAERNEGDLVLGVAWPLTSKAELFEEGVDLAVKEINDAGGVLGNQLRVIKRDDQASVTEGLSIAQQFASQLDMVGVIGHYNSSISVPASAIYENAGMVMLTPGSTAPKLTELGYQYVFRSIPNDKRIAEEMSHYAADQGYQNMAIYYTDDEYGRGLANAFEDSAAAHDIEIIDRVSSFTNLEDLKRITERWRTLDCDAIFLADVVPDGAEMISMLRQAGMEAPIIGGDGLDSKGLLDIAGAAAEGTVVSAFFNPHHQDEQVISFVERFTETYNTPPSTWAAQGYDAIYILTDAIKAAQSRVPSEIARTLREMENWTGVTGTQSFGPNGDIENKPIIKKVVRQGKFEFLD